MRLLLLSEEVFGSEMMSWQGWCHGTHTVFMHYIYSYSQSGSAKSCVSSWSFGLTLPSDFALHSACFSPRQTLLLQATISWCIRCAHESFLSLRDSHTSKNGGKKDEWVMGDRGLFTHSLVSEHVQSLMCTTFWDVGWLTMERGALRFLISLFWPRRRRSRCHKSTVRNKWEYCSIRFLIRKGHISKPGFTYKIQKLLFDILKP